MPYRSHLFRLALAACCLGASAQTGMPGTENAPLTAETIMARVAANQDQADAERVHYLYVQHARVTSRKGKTVMCEEVTDSRVVPTSTGSQQQLLKLDGRLKRKGGYESYTSLPEKRNGDKKSTVDNGDNDLNIRIDSDNDMDRDLVENMRKNLTEDRSKDGVGRGLFPLTTKSQIGYAFKLLRRETMNGRDCFHVEFQPKNKDDYDWKGDVYVDATAFQPVVIRTKLAHNVPLAVRMLLGTSVPGLGLTVVYAPQTGGLWFPVSFGTEFKVNVLFFFHREMVIAADNRNFERTHVTTTIHGVEPTP